MEMRKVIAFGKNSFVLTLPHDFVEKRKVKKGDLVLLEENKDGLTISLSPTKPRDEGRSITILAEGKAASQVRTELVSAYLNNYDPIIIISPSLHLISKEVIASIHGLAGLEVLEQTSSKVVAKSLLNDQEISLKALIRRMDILTQSMIEDAIKCIKLLADGKEKELFELANNIKERDEDVNRLYFLAYRVVKGALRNPSIANRIDTTPSRLHRDYGLVLRIETVADQAKGIAEDLQYIILEEKGKQELARIFSLVFQRFQETMKSYYTANKEIGYTIELLNDKMYDELDAFYRGYAEWLLGRKKRGTLDETVGICVAAARIVDGLKLMARQTRNLARVVYSFEEDKNF